MAGPVRIRPPFRGLGGYFQVSLLVWVPVDGVVRVRLPPDSQAASRGEPATG